MNSDQVGGAIRSLVIALGGFFAAFGLFANITAETWQTIGGAVAVVGGLVWSWWSNRDKAIVASAAAKVPVSATAQASVGIAEPVKPKE